ncbi:hypothetical protein CYMTET_36936 [Cymbomonas tetramitiformis]|uniref:Transmembrane protein 186 n=1 Tax=Cymbomonas tetramitiformis TaxID=36881 RepID=A0AAE0CF10_9CHLO|nr:hypothetical protein CYMTET_36936 [Cymbomonas tetramitiformis]
MRWYYSSRYIGELALLPQRNAVRISTLDFWGTRQDEEVHLRDVIPPLRELSEDSKSEMAHQVFIPLDVTTKRQYLISLRHGQLVDRAALFQLLDGTMQDAFDASITKKTT